MANLNRALQDLRQERSRAGREVERLDEAISVLEGLTARNHAGRPARRGRTARMGRPRHRMSAAGRRKIAAAQRARWARLKAKRLHGAKHRASAAARNRMAAAQRARWAQIRAEKKQKPAARVAKKPAQKVQAAAA
jgi:hypothetical protein